MKLFSDHLLQTEIISSSKELQEILTHCQSNNFSLLDYLESLDTIDEEDLLKSVAAYTNYYYDLIDRTTLDHRISTIIPEEFARTHNILALFQLGNTITVATTNPFRPQMVEELEIMTKQNINFVISPYSSIEPLYDYCYSYQESSDLEDTSMSSLFEMGMNIMDEDGDEDESYDLAQEAPIAKLVETIIYQALSEKASDIHIEPEEDALKIRFRVDGLLKEVMSPPKKLESPIISRLKIMSELDITETRKPQDGRITVTVKDKDVDFRVSTVRTVTGEKMVLRVLDKSGAFVKMEKLGLTDDNTKTLNSLLNSTSGIVIVCGPTGSGKTSTLYSALSKLNTEEKNIITIEDPVEFNLEGINQIPVNPKIGVDFVTGLSAIVRQDPDIIMIGEVRDLETATIAIQAALTGHLVFTTLHTRSAAGTVARLLDMGVKPFLLNSAIIGVIGQRLIRSICPSCKQPVKESDYTGFKQLEIINLYKKKYKDPKLFRGSGCKFCDNTGYKGRSGIFEIITLNEEIRSLVVQQASSEKIKQAASDSGMNSMLDDGFIKLNSGLTTVEEVTRVLDL